MVLTQEARDEMILSQTERVRLAAARIYRRIGRRVPFEDLMQSGYIGLIDAVDKYDGRVKFSSYVGYRIDGAILDSLREQDFLTREHRRDIEREEKLQPPSLNDPMTPHNTQLEHTSRVRDWKADLEIIEGIERHEAEDRMNRALAQLSPRYRLVMLRYFVQHVTLLAIGKELGVVESRASQLKKAAVLKLRLILS